MSVLQRSRRLIAIGSHRVLFGLAVLGLVYVPFAWVRQGLSVAVIVLLLVAVAVGLSVQLARSLETQRVLRRLSAQPQQPASTPGKPVAKRLAPAKRAPTPGRDVVTGRLLAGSGTDQLPVIGFAIVEAGEADVRRAVRGVAEHQVISASFKPLMILDEPYFDTARGYGYPAELIISARDWQGSQAERAAYLVARLDSIRQSYGCAGVIRVPSSGLDDFGRAQIDRLAATWATEHKVVLPGRQPRRTPPSKGTAPVSSPTSDPTSNPTSNPTSSPRSQDRDDAGLLVGERQVTP